MLSKMDMADIVAIENPQERDAALDALSEQDARNMLKSLVRLMRRAHDEMWEAKRK